MNDKDKEVILKKKKKRKKKRKKDKEVIWATFDVANGIESEIG